MILDEMNRKADEAVASMPAPEDMPQPPEALRQMIDEYDKAGLVQQHAHAVYETRKWQAKRIGFELMSEAFWDYADHQVGIPSFGGLFNEMLGGPPTREYHLDDEDHTVGIDWCYNHLYDLESDRAKKTKGDKRWHGNTRHALAFERRARNAAAWFLPPFFPTTRYSWWLWSMDQVKTPIPYDIMRKAAVIKKSKLFNALAVLAPRDAFESSGRAAGSIVLAAQWEFAKRPRDEYLHNTGNHAYYFLARWE